MANPLRHLNLTPWKKGVSGNPKGRPRKKRPMPSDMPTPNPPVRPASPARETAKERRLARYLETHGWREYQ